MTSKGPAYAAAPPAASAADLELTSRVAAKSKGCIAHTTAAPVTAPPTLPSADPMPNEAHVALDISSLTACSPNPARSSVRAL